MGLDISYWAELHVDGQWRLVGGAELLRGPPGWVAFPFGDEPDRWFFHWLMPRAVAGPPPELGPELSQSLGRRFFDPDPRREDFRGWIGLGALRRAILEDLPRYWLDPLEFLAWRLDGALPARPPDAGLRARGGHALEAGPPPSPAWTLVEPEVMEAALDAGRNAEALRAVVFDPASSPLGRYHAVTLPRLSSIGPDDRVRVVFQIAG